MCLVVYTGFSTYIGPILDPRELPPCRASSAIRTSKPVPPAPALKVAHKPYFRLIEPGLHLGYRKLANGPGTWVCGVSTGNERTYAVKNLKTADDRLLSLTTSPMRMAGSCCPSRRRNSGKGAPPARHGRRCGAFTVAKAWGQFSVSRIWNEGRPHYDSRCTLSRRGIYSAEVGQHRGCDADC